MAAVFGRSVLVTGTEAFIADREVNDRISQALSEDPSADVVEIDGPDLENRPFLELVGGTLFASAVVVYLNDVAYSPPEQFDAITATAREPHDGLCLIMRHNGGQKSKSFITGLAKTGAEVIKADPPKRANDWNRAIAEEAKRQNVRFDDQAVDALVQAVGKDLYAISAAIRQLASDHDSQHITFDVVRKYFAGRAEVSGFTVADALVEGRYDVALESVRWAFQTGVSPVPLVAAFSAKLRTLGKYLDLRSAGMRRSDLARELNVPEWTLDNLGRVARSWSQAGVSAAIRATAEADAGVKGKISDPEFAVERLIIQIQRAHQM